MHISYLLVFAAILLQGCQDNDKKDTDPAAASFVPRYELSATSGDRMSAPYPNDIWFFDSGSADGTLNLPVVSGQLPSTIERYLVFLNTLDGFSTTAPIRIPFNREIAATSLMPLNPADPSPSANIVVLDAQSDSLLVPGVAYDIEISNSDNADGKILNIVPLQPLKQNTTYMFFILSGISSDDGIEVTPDSQFLQIRKAWSEQGSIGDTYLDTLLNSYIAPVLDKGVELLDLPPESIMAAWSVTTQSLSDAIEAVADNARARPSRLVHSGLTTKDYDATLPGLADIYIGTMEIPYYQSRLEPYQGVWLTAQGAHPNRLDPVALPTETLSIPLLVTLPNQYSGHSRPDGGWPVIIFMDGLGGNRTRATQLADNMAAEGFAIVSIDQPLHGVTDPTNPLFQGPGNPSPLNLFGDNERHFFLDAFNNLTGLAGADGIIDSGFQLPGQLLLNPPNGRDTLRQSAADLAQLVLTIPTMDTDGDQTPDLNGTGIHFIGLSWSALQGPLFLGIDGHVTTATLTSPGGTWTDLLTDPESLTFGRPLLDRLADSGILYGTTDFDQWVVDWQTLLDPADGLNFALATATTHPLLMVELLGDTVIPNGPTERLAHLVAADPVSETRVAQPGETLTAIVRLTKGGHSSAVEPGINPAVTAEIQNQAAVFALSGGSRIEIDPNCDCVQ